MRGPSRCASAALAGLLCLAGAAQANGRFPATSSLEVRRGHPQDVLAGVTFGLVVSHDGGMTWQWMCERAIGYGGIFDPDYAYGPSGAVFATTLDGFRANRDTCTFGATPFGSMVVSQVEVGSDQAIYAAASDPADSKIYRSTDDGVTFPTSASPGQAGDYWDSLVVAPGDPMKLYLSGHRLNGGNPPTLLLFRSIDGGATFTAVPLAGLMTTPTSELFFVGVSATNAGLAYVKVSLEYGNAGEGIYALDTATGTTWTRLLDKLDPLAFVARASGELVAASPTSGAWHSTDGGSNWLDLPGAPHINCLIETEAGEVWACTHNYSSTQFPSDGFGIMKSTDLATWTGVFRYEDLTGPVPCAADTPQKTQCEDASWCALRLQLGVTAPWPACTGAVDATPVKERGGCCDAGARSGLGSLASGLVIALVLRRRQRAS